MDGTSCSRRGALLLRGQERRPRIPHRPAKDRCESGESPRASAGILAYVLVLIQDSYFVVVEDRQEGETCCVESFRQLAVQ